MIAQELLPIPCKHIVYGIVSSLSNNAPIVLLQLRTRLSVSITTTKLQFTGEHYVTITYYCFMKNFLFPKDIKEGRRGSEN